MNFNKKEWTLARRKDVYQSKNMHSNQTEMKDSFWKQFEKQNKSKNTLLSDEMVNSDSSVKWWHTLRMKCTAQATIYMMYKYTYKCFKIFLE